ncbi:MAG TPA: methyltransferase domain-containing protein [Gemmatimonadaceae bacterium]|nr:methyltransferase domain-containing protein [Gemmatimonadaceae bacterium]
MSEANRRERAQWEARYDRSALRPVGAPSAWVIRRVLDHTQEGALVVDVAGGRGRHALPLVRAGRRVVVVDFAERAVREVVGEMSDAERETSLTVAPLDGNVAGTVVAAEHCAGAGNSGRRAASMPARMRRPVGVVADCAQLPIRDGVADAVVCVNFLDRALFGDFARLLRPGGVLIVETYTAEQRRLGRGPSDPAHLLRPGELRELVAPFVEIVEYREGAVRDDAGERWVAGVVGRGGQGGGGLRT